MLSRHKGPIKEGNDGTFPPLPLSAWSKEYPHVFEFLTGDRYDDGTVRLPGTVLLCFGEGRLRLWLHDRDQGLSAWLSGESVEALFKAADQGLADATVEWRRPRPRG